jgi:hypothetical protein
MATTSIWKVTQRIDKVVNYATDEEKTKNEYADVNMNQFYSVRDLLMYATNPDKTEKQFQESEDLDISDWMVHRIFVQNMNDIDRQTILNLPPAQPEPKRGKWIRESLVTQNYLYKCSICKKYSRTMYDYCPNCGADMRKETEDGKTIY